MTLLIPQAQVWEIPIPLTLSNLISTKRSQKNHQAILHYIWSQSHLNGSKSCYVAFSSLVLYHIKKKLLKKIVFDCKIKHLTKFKANYSDMCIL